MGRSSKKTKKGFRDRGKFRRRLRELRQQRELALRDLGGLTFELHRLKETRPDLVEKKLSTLLEIDQEIQGLEHTLQAFRVIEELHEPGVSSCPSCGALHGTSANFCPSCGFSLKGARAIDSVQHGSEIPAKTPQQTATSAVPQNPQQTQLSKPMNSSSPLPPATLPGKVDHSAEYDPPKLTSVDADTLSAQSQEKTQQTESKPAPNQQAQEPQSDAHQTSSSLDTQVEATPSQQGETSINKDKDSLQHQPEIEATQHEQIEQNQHHHDEVPTVSSGDPLAG